MTDKWIGPRVLCGDSNPPPDGYEYVRRYADDVRLAAGSGTTVENENVAGYVAFTWTPAFPGAGRTMPERPHNDPPTDSLTTMSEAVASHRAGKRCAQMSVSDIGSSVLCCASAPGARHRPW